MGADEARAELHARRPHLEICQDRVAAADAARDEDRHLGDVRQDLLGEHAGRDGADVAARLHALDDDGVGRHAHELAQKEAQLEIEHFWAGALRRAVIDGDVEGGSLMAGQSVGMVTKEQPTKEILDELVGQAVSVLAAREGAAR